LLSCNPSKFLCSFTIKRRLRIDKYPKQSWLILLVESIESELDSIRQELFKLSFNRIVDPPKTANRLAFAGDVKWQTCRTLRTDGSGLLHAFYLIASVFNPLNFID